MFDNAEEGGEAGAVGAVPPVTPPVALPHGDPASIMLARRIARWMRRKGPRVFGSLDFEMAESLLVNKMRTRWATVATTPQLRAAVQVLTELGGFHARIRPPLPSSRKPVHLLMLRPSEAGLRYAEDEINRTRNQLPAAIAGRRGGPWIPNLLYFALRDHGVPPDQRQAAARYIDQHVVRPYLASLGYTGPNPEGELLYTNAQPRPAAKLPPSIVAQQALAALVAAPPVIPEPSPEPAPEPAAAFWVDAAGRKRQCRPAAAPAPSAPASPPPSAAPAPAGYLPSPAPAMAPSGPPSAPTAAPLAGTGNGLVGLSPAAAARHLAKAQAILARIGVTAATAAPMPGD